MPLVFRRHEEGGDPPQLRLQAETVHRLAPRQPQGEAHHLLPLQANAASLRVPIGVQEYHPPETLGRDRVPLQRPRPEVEELLLIRSFVRADAHIETSRTGRGTREVRY